MSYAVRHTIDVTTAADGSATAYTPGAVNGYVISVQYVKTDFANGSTMTLTAETTGTAIWAESNVDASATRAPRGATHGTTGTIAPWGVLDKIAIADERLKLVIANGGDTKTGTFYVTVE